MILDKMKENDTLQAIDNYNLKFGRRGGTAMSQLGKIVGFIEAVKTPVGLELMRDDIAAVESLLDKMINETITPEEMAELRYIKNKRMPKVIDRISTFIKGTEELTKEGR